MTKLWHEFIVEPPDAATLADITSTYVASGYKLKPLLAKILVRKQLFESLGEPNMIKPPVVYVVGAMRALGRAITDATAADYLSAMGQRPYFPPTVAGWEGGLSWLNTNTALARFDFVGKLLGAPDAPGLEDAAGETAAAAYERAYAAVGLPWLAGPTQASIREYAGRAPAANAAHRKQRQIVLRALMLAGPDAQVM